MNIFGKKNKNNLLLKLKSILKIISGIGIILMVAAFFHLGSLIFSIGIVSYNSIYLNIYIIELIVLVIIPIILFLSIEENTKTKEVSFNILSGIFPSIVISITLSFIFLLLGNIWNSLYIDSNSNYIFTAKIENISKKASFEVKLAGSNKKIEKFKEEYILKGSFSSRIILPTNSCLLSKIKSKYYTFTLDNGENEDFVYVRIPKLYTIQRYSFNLFSLINLNNIIKEDTNKLEKELEKYILEKGEECRKKV